MNFLMSYFSKLLVIIKQLREMLESTQKGHHRSFVTCSSLSLISWPSFSGISSSFWGIVASAICCCVHHLFRYRCPTVWTHFALKAAERNPHDHPSSGCFSSCCCFSFPWVYDSTPSFHNRLDWRGDGTWNSAKSLTCPSYSIEKRSTKDYRIWQRMSSRGISIRWGGGWRVLECS